MRARCYLLLPQSLTRCRSGDEMRKALCSHACRWPWSRGFLPAPAPSYFLWVECEDLRTGPDLETGSVQTSRVSDGEVTLGEGGPKPSRTGVLVRRARETHTQRAREGTHGGRHRASGSTECGCRRGSARRSLCPLETTDGAATGRGARRPGSRRESGPPDTLTCRRASSPERRHVCCLKPLRPRHWMNAAPGDEYTASGGEEFPRGAGCCGFIGAVLHPPKF